MTNDWHLATESLPGGGTLPNTDINLYVIDASAAAVTFPTATVQGKLIFVIANNGTGATLTAASGNSFIVGASPQTTLPNIRYGLFMSDGSGHWILTGM